MTTAVEGESPGALRRDWFVLAAVLLFFSVSGACGLLYQVVWTRKLVLLFGTTSYAVSTVLTIFFLGLGAGSLWGGRIADRNPNPLRLYGFFEIVIGLWALFFVFAVNYGEGAVVFLLKAFDFSRATGIALRALLAMGLLLVPVLLMGATLPLLARFVTRSSERLGQRVGGLYACNTLGAVAGCFFTGFFLLPALGYTQTTLLGMAANVGVGLLAILLSRGANVDVPFPEEDPLEESETLSVEEDSSDEFSTYTVETTCSRIVTLGRPIALHSGALDKLTPRIERLLRRNQTVWFHIQSMTSPDGGLCHTATFSAEDGASIFISEDNGEEPCQYELPREDWGDASSVTEREIHTEEDAREALAAYGAMCSAENYTASESFPVSPLWAAFEERRGDLLIAFGLSGFAMLALEVLWTRLLAIVFLGTTYAYTAMLTTLLIGIALGSAVAAFVADRVRNPAFLFGGVLVVAGACCMLTLDWIADLPEKVHLLHQNTGNDWAEMVRGKFLYAFGVLFFPAFFSGMTFPLVVRAVSCDHDRFGRDVGLLYCANTFGGVLGAAAGGFLLLPLLGAHNAILVLSGLLGLAGFAVLAFTLPIPSLGPIECSEEASENGELEEQSDGEVWSGGFYPGCGTGLAALAAAVALMALAWWQTPKDVSRALNAGYIPEDHRVIHFAEGVEGTVAVSEPADLGDGSDRVLWINRVQATASIEKGVKMNRFQGVLPLLFDRDPEHVLFMCFGSGITCGTLALSPFERIDAVEISHDVLEAAPLFDKDNLGVLERPNLVFHIDDGRNYLLTTDERYDLITFEPMPLALAGVSTFYTRDYYALCLDRLAPGGMVSQWIPLHSLSPEVVRSLAYTFTQVFPEYTAWFINADLFLIGSNAPLRIDYARIARHMENPALREALGAVGLKDIPALIGCFLMDKAGVDAFASGGEVMTDDRPWAEFAAPKLVYERKVPESIGQILPHVSSPVALLVADGLPDSARAAIALRHEARRNDLAALQPYYSGMAIGESATQGFLASLAIDPNDYNAQYYLKQIVTHQAGIFARWDQPDRAKALLGHALRYMPDDPELRQLEDEINAAVGGDEAR